MSPHALNLFDCYCNLKELYQCVPCRLNWALNEMEIRCNYKIALIGWNEKPQFLSKLTLNLDSGGILI